MILLDSGPLVGLIDPRDALHQRSRADVVGLAKRRMHLTLPVLTEALFLLRPRIARQKLRALLDDLHVDIPDVPRPVILAAFDWMDDYADHRPDFADALLVVLSSEIDAATVWTYDSEFRTIWRRPDGSRIPLAVK